jgi:hypothetical protein
MSDFDWESPEVYERAQDAESTGFAWECLRRNPDYRAIMMRSPADPAAADFKRRWGLCFRADPTGPSTSKRLGGPGSPATVVPLSQALPSSPASPASDLSLWRSDPARAGRLARAASFAWCHHRLWLKSRREFLNLRRQLALDDDFESAHAARRDSGAHSAATPVHHSTLSPAGAPIGAGPFSRT